MNSKYDNMGKNELRAACKAAGISYGKLNNDGMRTALALKDNPRVGAETQAPSAPVVPTPAPAAPAAKPAPKATASKPAVRTIEKNREERNGIKRPSAGTLCRQVWDALDKVGIDTATSQTAKSLAEKNGWNKNNVSIEFYQWRRFHGVEGRQPKPAAK